MTSHQFIFNTPNWVQSKNNSTVCPLIIPVVLRANIIMVNWRISSVLKECALTLWDRGWDYNNISDALLVSVASLYCWRNNFEIYGSVTRLPSVQQTCPLVGCGTWYCAWTWWRAMGAMEENVSECRLSSQFVCLDKTSKNELTYSLVWTLHCIVPIWFRIPTG